MQIPYLSNPETTEFHPVIIASLPIERRLTSGETVTCDLKKAGGYQGRVTVDISAGENEFRCDWSNSDQSRFPARIRAAATALRDAGFFGRFCITHKNGQIMISTTSEQISNSKEPRNSPWIREELILALELYLQNRKSPPSKISKQVESLSKELNHLAACISGSSSNKFRNASSVYLKMMNFRSYDPDYISQGKIDMKHGNKLEPELWREFFGKEVELSKACRSIREGLKEIAKGKLDDSEDDVFCEAPEGKLLTKLHKRRERSVKLVFAKKNWVMKKFGALLCEACGFNFAKVYGKRGYGFIECHHKKPVTELGDGHKTKIEDLALLCSNCHRMIHTRRPWLTVEELKSLL
jgi:5-methylcytosine-specific restriction protein A